MLPIEYRTILAHWLQTCSVKYLAFNADISTMPNMCSANSRHEVSKHKLHLNVPSNQPRWLANICYTICSPATIWYMFNIYHMLNIWYMYLLDVTQRHPLGGLPNAQRRCSAQVAATDPVGAKHVVAFSLP